LPTLYSASRKNPVYAKLEQYNQFLKNLRWNKKWLFRQNFLILKKGPKKCIFLTILKFFCKIFLVSMSLEHFSCSPHQMEHFTTRKFNFNFFHQIMTFFFKMDFWKFFLKINFWKFFRNFSKFFKIFPKNIFEIFSKIKILKFSFSRFFLFLSYHIITCVIFLHFSWS